jgi:hypothetical protein
MNQEQLESLKTSVAATKEACIETEKLISDYMKCESDIAKKYLGAAIKKTAAAIASNIDTSALS